MKLYLSSYRIPDPTVLSNLLGKPLAGAHVALVPNAKDYYAPRARAIKIRNMVQYLEGFGLQVTVFDLNDINNAAALLAELTKYDLLWTMGGNTFCLREAMRRSGFDQAIRDVLDQGIVYAGESAGACVCGSDLKGIELIDEPAFAEEVIWEGLQLTPHFIAPHADNSEVSSMIKEMIAGRSADPEVVVLNDNQAWVVDGVQSRTITGVKSEHQEV